LFRNVESQARKRAFCSSAWLLIHEALQLSLIQIPP
jgi:hypothetical protein